MTTPTTTPELVAEARKVLGLADDVDDATVQSTLSELSELINHPGVDEDVGEREGTEPVNEPEPTALSADTIAAFKGAGLSVIADSALETLETDAAASVLRDLEHVFVELRGIEPLTSSMPLKRSTN